MRRRCRARLAWSNDAKRNIRFSIIIIKMEFFDGKWRIEFAPYLPCWRTRWSCWRYRSRRCLKKGSKYWRGENGSKKERAHAKKYKTDWVTTAFIRRFWGLERLSQAFHSAKQNRIRSTDRLASQKYVSQCLPFVGSPSAQMYTPFMGWLVAMVCVLGKWGQGPSQPALYAPTRSVLGTPNMTPMAVASPAIRKNLFQVIRGD